MRGAGGAVLYVGKAKNVRQRLKQYFLPGRDSRLIIPYLVNKVETIETIVVTSEKEALLLENTLIKQHQPRYNALLKDDKTYAALRLTRHHPFPQLQIVRLRGRPKDQAQYFGPYTGGTTARRLFDLLNRLFPLRQCSDAEFARRTRPCILYDMKRCLAPCVGRCTTDDYQRHVERTVAFLQGRDKKILEEMHSEMMAAASALEFERAAQLRNRIEEVKSAWEGQCVEKYTMRDLDAFGLYRHGDDAVVCQLLFRGGKLIGSHAYSFHRTLEDNDELLSSLLLQYYQGRSDSFPHEIILLEPLSDAAVIAELLSAHSPHKIAVTSTKRGEKRALAEMAQANAAAEFHKAKEDKAAKDALLLELQQALALKQFPHRIECIDSSHLATHGAVAAIAAFTDGIKDSKHYRTYHIRTARGGDDYSSMKEVLLRRLRRAQAEEDLPDLLLIDGGKGHLQVAEQLVAALDIVSIDLIAIAKEEGRHDKGMTSEQLYLCEREEPLQLGRHSPLLHLLQTIRDEAHRAAITFQRRTRSKALISSELDAIPGIGPKKRAILLKQFGSVKKLKEATSEQFAAVQGINRRDIEALQAAFIASDPIL